MIFVTVGTQLSFDRLVKAVDDWAASRAGEAPAIMAQISDPGPQGYRPDHIDAREFMPPDAFAACFADADLIVGHAGMGTIINALTLGKPVLVMPRKASLGEHRNDHQMATARKFEGRNNIHIAWNEAEMPDLLDQLTQHQQQDNSRTISPFAQPSLTNAIRDFIIQGRPRP